MREVPNSIGLRFYRITVGRNGIKGPILFENFSKRKSVFKWFGEKLLTLGDGIDRDDLQRTWYIEPKECAEISTLHGLVNYGTYGYASDILAKKSSEPVYRRRATDIEQIPLYYRFWLPNSGKYGLAAFQSFSGKSCVTAIQDYLKEDFSAQYPEHSLIFKKLMPTEVRGGELQTALVKKVTYMQKSPPSDSADRYVDPSKSKDFELELVVSAKRRRSLGPFSELLGRHLVDGVGLLEFDGIKFNQARADIIVGDKKVTVGLFGYNTDAGVIEINDSIELRSDGHPEFDSITECVDDLLVAIDKLARGSLK